MTGGGRQSHTNILATQSERVCERWALVQKTFGYCWLTPDTEIRGYNMPFWL